MATEADTDLDSVAEQLPLKTIAERRKRGQEPGPVAPTQLELLAEIRDLLRAQQGLTPASEESGRHAHTGEFRRPV